MKQPTHTITLQPWQGISFSERLVLDMALMLLWPLKPDERMTVLINLMADQIYDIAENDDQIDAIIDVLRMQMKMKRQQSPPLQNH